MRMRPLRQGLPRCLDRAVSQAKELGPRARGLIAADELAITDVRKRVGVGIRVAVGMQRSVRHGHEGGDDWIALPCGELVRSLFILRSRQARAVGRIKMRVDDRRTHASPDTGPDRGHFGPPTSCFQHAPELGIAPERAVGTAPR